MSSCFYNWYHVLQCQTHHHYNILLDRNEEHTAIKSPMNSISFLWILAVLHSYSRSLWCIDAWWGTIFPVIKNFLDLLKFWKPDQFILRDLSMSHLDLTTMCSSSLVSLVLMHSSLRWFIYIYFISCHAWMIIPYKSIMFL